MSVRKMSTARLVLSIGEINEESGMSVLQNIAVEQQDLKQESINIVDIESWLEMRNVKKRL